MVLHSYAVVSAGTPASEAMDALQARTGSGTPDLPVGDLLVVAEPLVALHPRVVVDVVLAAPAPSAAAQDVVALELADRLEQVRRQRAQARAP